MNAKDGKNFSEVMYGLADNFGSSLTKPGMRMRFDALKAFSIEEINQAAMKILATRKYKSMPTIADFLEYLNPQIDLKSTAQIQADKVITHLRSYGAGNHPGFDDPITLHLMTRRWPYYNWAKNVLESELKWWVKEFMDAYSAYSSSGGAPELIEYGDNIKKLTESIGKDIKSVR